VVITRLNICVMEENKRDEKQAEKYSKDGKEINDYDHKHMIINTKLILKKKHPEKTSSYVKRKN
jgi:hypothetical protein